VILLHAFPSRPGNIGGLSQCVPSLITALNLRDDVQAALVPTVAGQPDTSETKFPIFHRQALLGSGSKIDLPAPFHRPDLVIFHSTYIPVHARIARRLRKSGVAYVICPHGGMTRLAQNYHRWKKKLGNLLFFNRLVNHAAALHCLNQRELEEARRWNRPAFVVGNGTELPVDSDLASPGTNGPLRFVFIGRLAVEHKGLDLLLDGCAILREELLSRRVRIEIHGPDFRGSLTVLQDRIARLQLEKVVSLPGPVIGRAKQRAFQQADVFVHTSRWEGHPLAVLEGLASGLPCLLTPGTNMAEEIAAAGAGWSVQPSAQGIAAGISQVLQTDASALREAGRRARQLACSQYDWNRVAARTLEGYRRYAA